MSSSGISCTSIQASFDVYHFQSYCIRNILEPVGAKSPAFSSESMGSIFRKRIGQSFALLCQAQSYPAPKFRQVFYENTDDR